MAKRRAQRSADQVEQQSGSRTENAPAHLHEPDPDDSSASPGGDQDIDTAGTDADDSSPTKAMGTGIARTRSRG
jgi:hypothetical protein